MKPFLNVLLFCFFSATACATQVYDTLYINKDTATIGLMNFQVCAFNDSSQFKPLNHAFVLNETDTLQLHIVNNDTLEHSFTIDGHIETSNLIPALGTNDFEVVLASDNAYRYYSNLSNGDLLGASGVIFKGYDTHPKFFWNMFEQASALSFDYADLSVNATPINYVPDVFTINFRVHPGLETDTLAKVIGNVGDTLLIATVNAGQMEHTLHFHGYHVEILNASHNTKMIGWSKDTYPIELNEVIVVRLVPHQEGAYPVHEHNLLNVTTNGVYPGGMLNLIEIQP
ncbi:MAG: hypothetical protein ACI857_001374 [Arenicella sp.]|jgi:hypothetical protein